MYLRTERGLTNIDPNGAIRTFANRHVKLSKSRDHGQCHWLLLHDKCTANGSPPYKNKNKDTVGGRYKRFPTVLRCADTEEGSVGWVATRFARGRLFVRPGVPMSQRKGVLGRLERLGAMATGRSIYADFTHKQHY